VPFGSQTECIPCANIRAASDWFSSDSAGDAALKVFAFIVRCPLPNTEDGNKGSATFVLFETSVGSALG